MGEAARLLMIGGIGGLGIAGLIHATMWMHRRGISGGWFVVDALVLLGAGLMILANYSK